MLFLPVLPWYLGALWIGRTGDRKIVPETVGKETAADPPVPMSRQPPDIQKRCGRS